jgi:hypothetical protein
MRTAPNLPRHQRRTPRLLLDSLVAISLLIVVVILTGCTVTVSPDGSKSATVDAPSAIRFIEIIATK